MLERVVLHIGLAKTGTTTLQVAMSLNRDLLRQHGFVYPVLPGPGHTGLAVYAAQEKASPRLRARVGVTERERRIAFIEEFPSQLAAAVAGPDIHTAILSNEYCSTGLSSTEEITRLHRLLSPLTREIRVVVYLRRQDDLAISLYSARMKYGGHTGEFEFVDAFWFDYLGLMDMWAQVFGRDQLVIRIFEPAQLHQDGLLADFCAAMGFEAHEELQQPPHINASLDVHALEFMRRFNAHVPLLAGKHVNPSRSNRECDRGYLNRGSHSAECRSYGSLPRQIRCLERRGGRQIPQSRERRIVYRASFARPAGAASLAGHSEGDRDCRQAVAMAGEPLSAAGRRRIGFGGGSCHLDRPWKPGAGIGYASTRAMSWHRSIALRRMAFGTRGNWLSFLARSRPPDRPERSQRHCDGCAAETLHDGYDDTGYGWYAQMWRCRSCGRESVKVWPIAF